MTTSSSLPFDPIAKKLQHLHRFLDETKNTAKMPLLFLGHGSPMNAIEDNEFVASFRSLGKEIEKPTAILVISAHWETRGTYVTAMEHPRTIHDFGGFPQALFDVQYPAPGQPALAEAVQELLTPTPMGLDHEWGLDHGSWSVVKHLYPEADVPVIQMSIDYMQPASYHYELAKSLAPLRHKGVLIVGSGNMVHNLRKISWGHLNSHYAFDWALEASDKMKGFILDGNHQALIDFDKQGSAFELAIPTPEHYLPMLYSVALQEKNEDLVLFNDSPIGGSLTMTSLKIG